MLGDVPRGGDARDGRAPRREHLVQDGLNAAVLANHRENFGDHVVGLEKVRDGAHLRVLLDGLLRSRVEDLGDDGYGVALSFAADRGALHRGFGHEPLLPQLLVLVLNVANEQERGEALGIALHDVALLFLVREDDAAGELLDAHVLQVSAHRGVAHVVNQRDVPERVNLEAPLRQKRVAIRQRDAGHDVNLRFRRTHRVEKQQDVP